MPRVKIFVGNIAIGTTSEDLRELFAQYGEITECDILGAGNYAFVHMTDETAANTAISELSNYVLNGSSLNVERSTSETQGRKKKELDAKRGGGGGGGGHSGIPKRSTTKIFIGNIKEGTTNDELRAVFEPHGTVSEADVVGSFGFVHMQSQAEAIKAIKALNGQYLNGNRLNIELSTEATQGRSRDTVLAPGAFATSADFTSRGRVPGRGRGHMLTAGKRFDPYGKVPAALTLHRSLLATDPYSSASYGYGYDPYAAADYASDPYASASSQATASSSDTFARDLLNLYIKNPTAFDKYAKDPMVQRSLNMSGGASETDDPYYRPPREYYEAKKATATPLRSADLEDAFTGGLTEGIALVQKRPLLPIGSGRGLAAASGGARPLLPVPGLSRPPLGPGSSRPRLARPANLYTSFE